MPEDEEGPRTGTILALFVIAALAIAAYAAVFLHLSRQAHEGSALTGLSPPTPSVRQREPRCPTARLPNASRLGKLAWIRSGSLVLIDLRTCRESTVLGAGVAPPVRFSPDGSWLAFGGGEIVPAAGGPVEHPLGSTAKSWQWSPAEDVLAGVTPTGGIEIGGPGREPRMLLPSGSRVGGVSFSPDGRSLAVDRAGEGIEVLDVATGRARTVFAQPDPRSAPKVTGWSPDGRWILYWRGPVRADGGPLDAVRASGGPWVNVFDPVLPYPDFLSWCGDEIALSAGGGKDVSEGKQIVLTGPPQWSFHGLTEDFGRSWFWPACSPDARWVAVTDTYNQTEIADRAIPRGLWLLATDGSSRRLVVPGTEAAPELPRWSSDGSVVLVVLRTGSRWSSPGRIALVRINPSSGHLIKELEPIANLGRAPGPGGHQQWSSISDWYRP
jgi:dipeptidyl aminopeptidase/acylaminoacyl peptidase